jgi:glycosyltransferase involved in cell wall biosynthesis
MELVEPPLRLDKQAYALLDRWAGKRCQAAVIAVSSELAGSLTQDYPPERICIIRNGISAGYVRMAAVAEPQIPNSGNRIRLAYLGRLVPVKRVDRLIQAFRILLNCAPDEFALFIIGDGPERDALIRLAERLGVSANVHFLGHRADPHACLGRMEIVLLASEHEGLPMAALEALSLGIMPVVPPVGGLPELLEAAQFGKIAKSSSPEDLAAAVLDAAASGRPCSAVSRLPERWSIEYSAQMHIQLYRAVLRRDPCPAAAVRELEAR